MDYAGARSFISSLPRFAPQPGLDRMRALLGSLGDPQDAWQCLHIGGTNGKGSATAVAASILSAAGYRTGRYTSPHLAELGERMSIDGQDLDRQGIARLVGELAPIVTRLGAQRGGESIIEFEMLTAMGFTHFAQQSCDVAVLEVGLGGRYDATNVVRRPLSTAITSIGRDHTEVLGESLASIAAEKAGIIKPGVPVITAVRSPEALGVIRDAAELEDSQVWMVMPADLQYAADEVALLPDEVPVRWRRTSHDLNGQTFDLELPGANYDGLRIGLLGRHQLENVVCAVAAVHGAGASVSCVASNRERLSVPESALRAGLRSAVWPGRCELIKRDPYVMLDGAHNPQGVDALCSALDELFPGRRPVVVIGALGDKDIATMIKSLARLARLAVVTQPSAAGRAAVEPAALAAMLRAAGVPAEVRTPVAEAVQAGWDALEGPDDLLLITGSLYLVAEARAALVPCSPTGGRAPRASGGRSPSPRRIHLHSS